MKMKSNLFAIAHMSNYKREMVLYNLRRSKGAWNFITLVIFTVNLLNYLSLL
jgi:hypothetical protein